MVLVDFKFFTQKAKSISLNPILSYSNKTTKKICQRILHTLCSACLQILKSTKRVPITLLNTLYLFPRIQSFFEYFESLHRNVSANFSCQDCHWYSASWIHRKQQPFLSKLWAIRKPSIQETRNTIKKVSKCTEAHSPLYSAVSVKEGWSRAKDFKAPVWSTFSPSTASFGAWKTNYTRKKRA